MNDQYHQSAWTCAPRLRQEFTGVTSECVVYETISYLNCSAKAHHVAIAFLDFLNESGVPVRTVDNTAKQEALELFRQYADKAFSFTDCTSFVLMRREGITQYAGFDDHFKAMGFQPIVL